MKRSSPIPIYNLQERAAKNFELSEVASYQNISHWNKAHRDDNFLLMYQDSGYSKLIVDFKEITIEDAAIFCILPGQVHYGVNAENTFAWALAVDAACIKDNFRTVLMDFSIRNTPVLIEPKEATLFRDSFTLLKRFDQHTATKMQDEILQPMLDVCIGLFASNCSKDHSEVMQGGLRPALITRQFRCLLMISFREMKGPADYAATLNISASYLNEVVKDTTGHPVSHWIHQEIILEAKRMLFYTNSTVKEISYLLGYTDTTYFIRLFGKVAGMAPLQFRSNYRR